MFIEGRVSQGASEECGLLDLRASKSSPIRVEQEVLLQEKMPEPEERAQWTCRRRPHANWVMARPDTQMHWRANCAESRSCHSTKSTRWNEGDGATNCLPDESTKESLKEKKARQKADHPKKKSQTSDNHLVEDESERSPTDQDERDQEGKGQD